MIIKTEEPDELLKSFWSLNEKYPDYVTCMRFDGVNPPYHVIEEAREIFRKKLLSHIEKCIISISENIEIFQEDGLDITELLNLRKKFRSYKNLNLLSCQTVEELESFFPKDLKEFSSKTLKQG